MNKGGEVQPCLRRCLLRRKDIYSRFVWQPENTQGLGLKINEKIGRSILKLRKTPDLVLRYW